MERLKILLVIFILFFTFFILFLYPKFTAMLKDILKVSLDVGEYMEACSYLFVPTEVIKGSVVNITTYCRNCGNMDYNGYTEVNVRPKNSDTIVLYETSEIYFLKPREEYEFSISWLPTSQGRYIVTLFCHYPGNYTNTSVEIEVKAPPPRPVQPPPGIPVAMKPPFYNISVEYTPKINVTQEADCTLLIKVINLGDTIHNLTVEFDSEIIDVKLTYPLLVSQLEKGESVLFVSTLRVESGIEPRKYPIRFSIISDEISREYEIIVNVVKLKIKEKAKNLLDYYESVLRYLEDEVFQKEVEGYDVSRVKPLLEDAKDDLEVARNLYKLGLYNDCIMRLEIDLKRKIEEIAVELTRLRKIPKPPVALPAYMPSWIIYLFVLLIVVFIVVFILISSKGRRGYPYLPKFKRW